MKSVSTIKRERQRMSYITFKSEMSRHDFCAKHMAKYIVIMETRQNCHDFSGMVQQNSVMEMESKTPTGWVFV